jgi:hypothetical protein
MTDSIIEFLQSMSICILMVKKPVLKFLIKKFDTSFTYKTLDIHRTSTRHLFLNYSCANLRRPLLHLWSLINFNRISLAARTDDKVCENAMRNIQQDTAV